MDLATTGILFIFLSTVIPSTFERVLDVGWATAPDESLLLLRYV